VLSINATFCPLPQKPRKKAYEQNDATVKKWLKEQYPAIKVHHSNLVKQWVEKHVFKIALFFLPSYSPKRNPDEYLNCDLRYGFS